MADQGRRGHPALGGRRVPHHPARGAAATGDDADPEEVLRQVRGGRRAAPGARRRKPPSWRPSSPARPPSATRTTSPGPRRSTERARRARTRRRHPRRSGSWMSWSRPPAIAWPCRRPGRSSAEPADRYNPLSSWAPAAWARPTCCTRSATRSRRAAEGPGRLPRRPEFTSELIEAIDRNAGRSAGARGTGRRGASCSTTCISWPARSGRQDELFLLFNFLIESGRQIIFTSDRAALGADRCRGAAATRARGWPGRGAPGARSRTASTRCSSGWSWPRSGAPDAELVDYLGSRPARVGPCGTRALLQRVLNAAESRVARQRRRSRARCWRRRRPSRPAVRATRSSGVVAPASGARKPRKIVWDWPDVGDRLVEERR